MTNGDLPTVQGVIVLQGRGALAAYDTVMLKALLKNIHQIDGDRGKKGKTSLTYWRVLLQVPLMHRLFQDLSQRG